jgi:hypothetical protein
MTWWRNDLDGGVDLHGVGQLLRVGRSDGLGVRAGGVRLERVQNYKTNNKWRRKSATNLKNYNKMEVVSKKPHT